MDVRKMFLPIIEAAQRDKKTEAEVITLEMSLGQAQNFLTLVQRAKITGALAEKYKKVVDAIYEANKLNQTGGK